jgi:hypothetical protein
MTAASPPRSAMHDAETHRGQIMMKSTAMALVVALATSTAPAAKARPYGAHSHHAASRVTKTVRGPGYAGAYPVGAGYARPYAASPNWGSECATDEGQGRTMHRDQVAQISRY